MPPLARQTASLNANDSRMQQVAFANGRLWGALDTAVNVGGQNRAGIAFYVINPNSKKIVVQGQAGIANTDLTYPAVGVTQSGRGVIAFTLTGDNNFPSAALAGLDAIAGMGSVQEAAAGAGAVGWIHLLRDLRQRTPALGRLWRSGGGWQ